MHMPSSQHNMVVDNSRCQTIDLDQNLTNTSKHRKRFDVSLCKATEFTPC